MHDLKTPQECTSPSPGKRKKGKKKEGDIKKKKEKRNGVCTV